MIMIRKIAAALALVLGCGVALDSRADSIRQGEWEYTTTMKMPGMPTQQPQLPPGAKLPAGMKLPSFGPEGMTRSYRECTTEKDLVPQPPDEGPQKCETTRFDRQGNTVHWSMRCSGPEGEMSGEGSATYSGDTMSAEMRAKGSHRGRPIEMTQKTTGRYIGPCKS
jgi:hypothetical protein